MDICLSVSKPAFLVRDIHALGLAAFLDQWHLWPVIFIDELAAECVLSIKTFLHLNTKARRDQ